MQSSQVILCRYCGASLNDPEKDVFLEDTIGHECVPMLRAEIADLKRRLGEAGPEPDLKPGDEVYFELAELSDYLLPLAEDRPLIAVKAATGERVSLRGRKIILEETSEGGQRNNRENPRGSE